ncbi:MAG: radical SAM protein [archaeon]
MKSSTKTTLPKYYTIDISSGCNLQCRYCPQGQKINPQPAKPMTFEQFKVFTKDVMNHAYSICLTNWTEPFLNSDISEIVSYIKQTNKNIHVSLSTNGNSKKIDSTLIGKLIDSGIDSIEVSISGVDQSTYQVYHQGGLLTRAAETIYIIAREKKERGFQKPDFYINYLTFPYNVASFKKVDRWLNSILNDSELKRMINKVRPIRGTILGGVMDDNQIMKHYQKIWNSNIFKLMFRPRCNFVFEHLYIRADGKVYPCCLVPYDEKYCIGDITVNDLKSIWSQSESFRTSFVEGTNVICNNCFVFHGLLPLRNWVSIYLNLRLFYQVLLHCLNKIDKTLFKEYFFRNQSLRRMNKR